jgi:hypothetical protein
MLDLYITFEKRISVGFMLIKQITMRLYNFVITAIKAVVINFHYILDFHTYYSKRELAWFFVKKRFYYETSYRKLFITLIKHW